MGTSWEWQKVMHEIFLEKMTEKTMQWEGFNDKLSTTFKSKGNIYSIENSIAAEANIGALTRRIEDLEVKRTPLQLDYVNQISAPSCFNHYSPTHVLEDYPLLSNPLASNQDQLNAVF